MKLNKKAENICCCTRENIYVYGVYKTLKTYIGLLHRLKENVAFKHTNKTNQTRQKS